MVTRPIISLFFSISRNPNLNAFQWLCFSMIIWCKLRCFHLPPPAPASLNFCCCPPAAFAKNSTMLRIYKKFIYQLFWTQACPEGMCTNGTKVPCEVPSLPNPATCKGWPHHRGLWPLLFSNSDVGSFTSHKKKSVKVLWDGTYGFSSLSEKTRKYNHLQMSLQKQQFLFSCLKTLSVGPAGVLFANS